MANTEVVPGLEFDPVHDMAQSPAWFLDGTHSVPPWTPMFSWFWINFCRHGMQYGAEKLSLPTVKGWDWRHRNGGGYLTLLLVKSEEEKKAREVKFRDAIRPFIADYDGLWNGCVEEMLGRYAELKKCDVDNCTSIELLANFEETINVCRRMWEIHMYMMYGTNTCYILFENMCRQMVGIDDTHPTFHALITGFDHKVFQVDKAIYEYAKKAEELGLASIFVNNDPKDIGAKLSETPTGRELKDEIEAFAKVDGWRMQRMAEINLPTWVEDQTPIYMNMKAFLVKGGDFNLDAERAHMTKQRIAAEQEVLAKIPADQRSWFTALMKVAQKTGIFSEEHDHYFDLYTHAMMRRVALAMGKRWVKAGTIDVADDIFMLNPDEVRKCALTPDQFNVRHIVDARKAEYQGWLKNPNPPVILADGFDMDMAMGVLVQSMDPIALKVVVGSMPVVRPELKADLYGTCGSPGSAEGTARVILSEDQLAEVQPGDILVAATTSPSWTPVFSTIKGVVVDRGASLSHAAIVGREYGIPVLMNVFVGTEKVKSGMRIRIDANMGTLHIVG